MRCLKPCSDQCWKDDLRFSIWRFFKQFAFVNNHQMCYWPRSLNSISKICPKFQVLSSQFFWPMSCSMSTEQKFCKIVQNENISTPIYVECIDQRFAFKNSGISCLAFIFNLSNKERQSCTQKIGSRLRDTITYTQVLVKASRGVSGNMGSILSGYWNSLHWAR